MADLAPVFPSESGLGVGLLGGKNGEEYRVTHTHSGECQAAGKTQITK